MAKAKAEKSTKKNTKTEKTDGKVKQKGKPKVAFKDVAMAAMFGHIDGVENMENRDFISAAVAWKAVEYVREHSVNDAHAQIADELTAWAQKNFGDEPRAGRSGGPGRGPAQIGDSRSYKVQEGPKKKDDDGNSIPGSGEAFLRLPLAAMNALPGNKVKVSYIDENKIIVEMEDRDVEPPRTSDSNEEEE